MLLILYHNSFEWEAELGARRKNVDRNFRKCYIKDGSTVIVFWSKQEIYIKQGINMPVLVNRYFEPRGVYRNWRNMCNCLKRRKDYPPYLSAYLASHYGVQVCAARHMPPVEGLERLK